MAQQRRAVANPLALAVLASLVERPMHPYEMAATMREYGKERSIRLNYGSLYTVVANLARRGLIEAVEARREGRRPERTVYRITDAGRDELQDWLSDLLAHPVKEYPQFEAALSELPVVAPDRVLALLRERVTALQKMLETERAELATLSHLPRLFLLEAEYHLTVLEAELAWTRRLAGELADGSFPWLDGWRAWHQTGEMPAEMAQFTATGTGSGPAASQRATPGPGAGRQAGGTAGQTGGEENRREH